MRSLYLGDNNLDSNDLAAFLAVNDGPTELNILELQRNLIGEVDNLSDLTMLTSLLLDSNSILSIAPLSTLVSLTSREVRDTRVESGAIERMELLSSRSDVNMVRSERLSTSPIRFR